MGTPLNSKQDIAKFMSEYFAKYENYSSMSDQSISYIKKQLNKEPIHTETINVFMFSKASNRTNYLKIYRVPGLGNFYIKEERVQDDSDKKYTGYICVESFPFVSIGLWADMEETFIKDYKCYVVRPLKQIVEKLTNNIADDSLLKLLKHLTTDYVCITGLLGTKDMFVLGVSILNIKRIHGKVYVGKLAEKSILVLPFNCKSLEPQAIIGSDDIYKIIEKTFNIKLDKDSSCENTLNKVTECILSRNDMGV